ncbi:hypothetical protein SAMN04488061_1274 [Filomicrobium insigne]|uniref:Uncharacterized protein n=1 Tax=Filomicrobium insigne TaxID=418854 RepID=A0A1H0L656_9HYPH|nr:hypothetical protein SAMN04488061_1274 [Filomicrobium insigne]
MEEHESGASTGSPLSSPSAVSQVTRSNDQPANFCRCTAVCVHRARENATLRSQQSLRPIGWRGSSSAPQILVLAKKDGRTPI